MISYCKKCLFGFIINPEVATLWWMEAKSLEMGYTTKNKTFYPVGSGKQNFNMGKLTTKRLRRSKSVPIM